MEQRRLELVFAGKICRRGDRKHASALAAAEAGVRAIAWGKASAEKTAWDHCGGLDCGASSQPRELQI